MLRAIRRQDVLSFIPLKSAISHLTLPLGETLRSWWSEDAMFSIGQFSRITGLTIKTIRLYHEKGLLIPCRVDESTGYRYFDGRNVERARAISYLRELLFPLSDIKLMLDQFSEDADILVFLETHKGDITRRIKELNKTALKLEEIIQKEREAKDMLNQNSFSVIEREIDSILVAGLRWKGRYSDVGGAFQKLGKLVGRYIRGKPMNLYYDGDYREEDADIETCYPVQNKVKQSEAFILHQLQGGKCVCLVHKGPYDLLSRSYSKIMEYMQERKYQALLPTREVYLKGPGMIFRGNPKNYLTEIQIMIAEQQDGSPLR